jgi:hypothetical protein
VPEIWENPFANAHLKVERANKHIDDIEKRLRTSSDSYGLGLHMNADTGEKSLDYFYRDRTLRSDIALIAGDAVHNLHSALDIVWCGAVKNLSPDSLNDYTKFPIYPKSAREELKATLLKRKIFPSLVDLVVDRVKSYKGGDADILALHKLDINDKHILLIPMLTATGIEGVEIENEDGTIDRIDILLAPPPNCYRKTVPLQTKLKNHGEIRFKVTFREGTPLENLEVIPILQRLSWKTDQIVRALQRMAQR